MDVILLIGRILFGALFIFNGIGHLAKTNDMAGYTAAKGVPAARPATIASGVLILLGGISVILGLWGDLGSIFLLVFLLSAAFLMHAFWKETDPMSKMAEQTQFNKDIALAGAALGFLWIFLQDPALTLTTSLF